MNIAVLIDGVSIGSGGSFMEPISRNHGRPMIFYLPEVLTKDKRYVTLTVRITDNPWALGYLGPVFFGDAALLATQFKTREFLQVLLPTSIGLVMIFFSVSSFYVFLRRRSETQYFWFALAMALFTIDTFNVFITNIPVKRIWWEIYVQAIVFAFATSIIIFVHRFTNTGWRRMEPSLAALFLAQVALLSVLGEHYFYAVKNLFNISIMAYGCVLLFLVARKYLQTSSNETGITALSGTVLLTFSIHTWLIHSGVLSPENLHTIHFAAPGFFILISFSLLSRFLSSLQETEELACSLDQRVKDKEQELIASYEKVKALEQKQAIADEHERIMRDMHDGFAGQLVGAIAMADSKQPNPHDVSKHLRSALFDLRIMIDSLDPNTRELPVALGMLRTRIQPVLDSRNVTLAWDVETLPDELVMNRRKTLSILRILQESITNMVKHSIGSTVKIAVGLTEEIADRVIDIRIWEDGEGFDPLSCAGRGLTNTRRRIAELKGNIAHQSVDNGFEIRIAIPVD